MDGQYQNHEGDLGKLCSDPHISPQKRSFLIAPSFDWLRGAEPLPDSWSLEVAASTFPSALRGREGSDRFQLSHQRVPKTGRVATGAKSHGGSLGCRAAIGWDQLQCGDGCVWQGAGVADGIGTLSGQGSSSKLVFLLGFQLFSCPVHSLSPH